MPDQATHPSLTSAIVLRFAAVFFIPGNHDLWMNRDDPANHTSLDKIDSITALCDRLGVHTRAQLIGAHGALLTRRAVDVTEAVVKAKENILRRAAGSPSSHTARTATDSDPESISSSSADGCSSSNRNSPNLDDAGSDAGAHGDCGWRGAALSDGSDDDVHDGDRTPGLWIVPLHSWYAARALVSADAPTIACALDRLRQTVKNLARSRAWRGAAAWPAGMICRST